MESRLIYSENTHLLFHFSTALWSQKSSGLLGPGQPPQLFTLLLSYLPLLEAKMLSKAWHFLLVFSNQMIPSWLLHLTKRAFRAFKKSFSVFSTFRHISQKHDWLFTTSYRNITVFHASQKHDWLFATSYRNMTDHSPHLTETGLTVPVHCCCASTVHTSHPRRTSHPRLPAPR